MAEARIWYPHYVERYRRKTSHLTIQEHGAYRLLIDAYWDRGEPLPADETRLRKIIGADAEEWAAVREAVLPFFTLTSDGYRHKTIDEVAAEADRLCAEKRARMAKARAAKAPVTGPITAPIIEPVTGSITTPATATPLPLPSPLHKKESKNQDSRAPNGAKIPSQELALRETTPLDELSRVLDPELAMAVIEHRKKLKKPMTARGARGLAAQFAKCRDGPAAGAEAMITNGWQGFSPEWMEKRNGNGNSNGRDRSPPRVVEFVRELRAYRERDLLEQPGREPLHDPLRKPI